MHKKLHNQESMYLVDQIKSPTPGLIAQLTGRLTTKRDKISKIFVDQSTRFIFSRFQKTDRSEENIKAKQAFR